MIHSRDDGFLSSRTGKAIEILETEVLKTRKMFYHLSKKPRSLEEDLDLADLRLRLRILKSELDGLVERTTSHARETKRNE
ncbi:MAG: hypothetical protein ACFFCS_12220 [Candidatus Hodarchaeota archaeon]